MKILVTGGCGFIGTNLVRNLVQSTDHHVVNVDKLTYAANPKSLEDIADSSRYDFEQVDLSDAVAVEKVVNQYDPDAVMHLAAESHVDRSIDGPSDFIQSNILGTYHLLEAALRHYQKLKEERRRHFRLLHVSTDEVFGSLGETGKFTESSRYDPRSPYSASKASSDHLVRAWHHTYGLPVIISNCSNNFGPYQFPEKLIPLMIIRALREQPLPVYGQGHNIRDWLFVEDHVEALKLLLEHGRVGETYNIGGDNEHTNIALVHRLCEILDQIRPRKKGPYADLITYVSDRPGHDFRYAIDDGKIQRELGWHPERDFDVMLEQTVRWYLDHQQWWESILDGRYHLQRLGQTRGPRAERHDSSISECNGA